jgi:Flp pilus assembly protein TadB
MSTWVWIVIAVAVVVVVALFVVASQKARARRLESKRTEAQELRQEAGARERKADERGALASDLADQERTERHEARMAAKRADEIDPDVET